MMAEEPAGGGGPTKGTFDIPMIGRTKRVYVYGAAAVVAVIVAYAYWRRSAAGASPLEEELSYYADLRTGSDTGDDAYEGADDSITGSSGSSIFDRIPRTPTTDQEWTAAVVNTLSHYEPDYLYGVLGKYLARQGLTASEATVIRAAWAAVGRPPGGQQIILSTDTSTPGTSQKPAAPTGLTAGSIGTTSARLTWKASTGAAYYRVIRSNGTVHVSTGTSFDATGLTSKTPYSYVVKAVNAHGESAASSAVKFTTKSIAATTKPPAKPAKPGTKPATKPQVSRTLRMGSRGEDVKIVQRIVGTSPDGIFGSATHAAVKRWQTAHGLKADGIVGPDTQKKMGI